MDDVFDTIKRSKQNAVLTSWSEVRPFANNTAKPQMGPLQTSRPTQEELLAEGLLQVGRIEREPGSPCQQQI